MGWSLEALGPEAPTGPEAILEGRVAANTPTGREWVHWQVRRTQWDTEGLPSAHLPGTSKNKTYSRLYGSTTTWVARTPLLFQAGLLRRVLTHQQRAGTLPGRSDEALHSSVPRGACSQ